MLKAPQNEQQIVIREEDVSKIIIINNFIGEQEIGE